MATSDGDGDEMADDGKNKMEPHQDRQKKKKTGKSDPSSLKGGKPHRDPTIAALQSEATALKKSQEEAEMSNKKSENPSFQWQKSHTHYSGEALSKLCRIMVREAINAERSELGLAPFTTSQKLYDSENRPDWWPLENFSSAEFKKKGSAIKIYDAARKVLSVVHGVQLQEG